MSRFAKNVGLLLSVGACLLVFIRLTQAEPLRHNSHLLCPLKQYLADNVRESWQCYGATEWDDLARQSLTLAALHAQLQYKLDQSDAQRVARCASLCECEPPAPWHARADRADPRNQLITYYQILAYFDRLQQLPDLSACQRYLLSSTYFYHAEAPLRVSGVPETETAVLAALNQELAYLVDQGWLHARWRGVNALRQGLVYQENEQLDLARAAYARALEALPESDHRQKERFVANAYRGLAEIAAAENDLDGALAYYEQSLRTNPHEGAATLGAYIRLLYARPEVEGNGRLQALLHELDHDPLLVSAVQEMTALPDIPAAQKLLAPFLAARPNSAHVMAAAALLAVAQQDLGRAEQLYENAIALQAAVDPATAAQWATQLAGLRRRQKDWLGGIEAQKLAVTLAPTQHGHWYKLALFYAEQDAFESALAAIDQALAIAPDNAHYLDFRAGMQGRAP
jgi:tetratricopeptide (TPR) repeat protein